jgi:hypothetical protein
MSGTIITVTLAGGFFGTGSYDTVTNVYTQSIAGQSRNWLQFFPPPAQSQLPGTTQMRPSLMVDPAWWDGNARSYYIDQLKRLCPSLNNIRFDDYTNYQIYNTLLSGKCTIISTTPTTIPSTIPSNLLLPDEKWNDNSRNYYIIQANVSCTSMTIPMLQGYGNATIKRYCSGLCDTYPVPFAEEPPTGYTFTNEVEITNRENDISSGQLISSRDCAALCDADNTCGSYVIYPSEGRCHLKSVWGPTNTNPGATSYIKNRRVALQFYQNYESSTDSNFRIIFPVGSVGSVSDTFTFSFKMDMNPVVPCNGTLTGPAAAKWAVGTGPQIGRMIFGLSSSTVVTSIIAGTDTYNYAPPMYIFKQSYSPPFGSPIFISGYTPSPNQQITVTLSEFSHVMSLPPPVSSSLWFSAINDGRFIFTRDIDFNIVSIYDPFYGDTYT